MNGDGLRKTYATHKRGKRVPTRCENDIFLCWTRVRYDLEDGCLNAVYKFGKLRFYRTMNVLFEFSEINVQFLFFPWKKKHEIVKDISRFI